MKNYKELEVWQRAIELATEVYEITNSFPDREKFGLISQMQRAAVSVAANIAEGWGRGSTKEYIQFLRIARGSLMELETHFVISSNIRYIKTEDLNKVQQEIEIIGKMLNALIKSLDK